MGRRRCSKKRCPKWLFRWLCGCRCNQSSTKEYSVPRCRYREHHRGERDMTAAASISHQIAFHKTPGGSCHSSVEETSNTQNIPTPEYQVEAGESEYSILPEPQPHQPAEDEDSRKSAHRRRNNGESTFEPSGVSEDQESSEGQDSGAVSSEEDKITSCFAAKVCFEVKQDYTNHQFLGPEGNVDVELIDKSTNRYSVWFPTAGWYLWSATGLGFLVRDAVTVTIAFGSWSQHLALDLQHHEQWLVGGPLFDVTAEPEEAVAEIHLPHFISLQAGEVDVSWFLVAHFKDEGMVLEHPARVEPFYAVLEKPSFSLMGILLRIASGTCLSIPITSNTLIYYHPHPEDIKFHLYLVPSDALLTKAIDDEEDRFHGVRLQTSPPVEPLNFGSSYIVSNSANLKVMPKELKLSYRSPGEIQHFSKFYAGQMKEPIQLEITEKRHGTLVWDTEVKPVDLQLAAASAPPPFSGAAFVKENHRQLQARMGDLKGVLDDLQDNEVLTENEKELVEQEKTRQSKNEALLSMVEKKGDRALDVLFRSISERDPYLVSYLRQQNL
ncbi:caspase recruitment domain-containing protein 8 isoform X7 [Pan troglodytes]|uniref:caspase recruitment domain-containing protein 8 isoform X7 n=1 Tax=Pan troglodytes TaxID=9598 RepID=UPI0007DBC7AE|nr:caspase recruitment domain-containing protein 8-like isoform X7 [Pan troglodytes]